MFPAIAANPEGAPGGVVSVPVPFTVILTVAAFRSLLRMVSVEYFTPVEAGVKVTVMF